MDNRRIQPESLTPGQKVFLSWIALIFAATLAASALLEVLVWLNGHANFEPENVIALVAATLLGRVLVLRTRTDNSASAHEKRFGLHRERIDTIKRWLSDRPLALLGIGVFFMTGGICWKNGVAVYLPNFISTRHTLFVFPKPPFALAIGAICIAAAWLNRPRTCQCQSFRGKI